MSYASINPMSIDTHFHIFDQDQIDQANSRYSVSFSASIEDWFAVSEKQGISKGVIIQPSFLGTDNSLMLKTIERYPDRLKGVGVVSPSISKNQLRDLNDQGLRGIRLNLSENPDPVSALKNYYPLIEHLNHIGMHLQIHHDDGLLNQLLINIPQGTEIVIDHFGRPSSDMEFQVQNDGIERHRNSLWVKLSAPYRTPQLKHSEVYRYWLNQLGSSRLLWGSDWPHTQFDSKQNYESQMQAFFTLCTDQTMRNQILLENPKTLYWS